jgi:LytR cell envelope-related transcriptional attenuator/Tetratricopeptide repeat
MHRGVNALMFTAAMATAGCVTDANRVQIRPVADAFSKATKAGTPAVAEGRGLLAVGSVGLAIEAFRKALREEPDNIEALAGLAECYDQMGRHDLSQAKYEAALAIAPNDPTLLRTFAASLDRQGRFAEATELRGEAADSARAEAAAVTPMPPARMPTVEVRPAPVPQEAIVPSQPRPVKVAEALAQAQSQPAVVHAQAAPNVELIESAPVPRQATMAKPADVELKTSSLVSRTAWAMDVAPIAPPPEASASVTVKLPPATQPRLEAPTIAVTTPAQAESVKVVVSAGANPATVDPVPAQASAAALAPAAPSQPAKVEVAAAPSVTVKLPPAVPAAAVPAEKPLAPVHQMVADAVPTKPGPRLQRLSLAEVALVTEPRPRWPRDPSREVAVGSVPRFVPLAELQRGYGVRLLNAARQEGLAARTRLTFNERGWKSITIGDSGRVREHSLVLYSEKTEKAARRLAARFNIWIAKEARPGPLTVLLGRDWAKRSQARA